MNENTLKLLEQLAQKLGTTTEYLWNILIKQAYIDATITLIQIIIVVIYCIVLWKLHIWLCKIPKNEHLTRYEKHEELAGIPMFLGLSVAVILLIVSIISLQYVFIGYLHPEYWALKEILNNIK